MQLACLGNFPTETAAVEALARALERAAMDSGIRMQAILDECFQTSQWCPTPLDLRTLAGAMKDKAREKREGNKHAKWREIYGEPNPQWAGNMLAKLTGKTPAEERAKALEQRIRDMLYYTEGEGKELGDRKFWEGPRYDGLPSAREIDLRDHSSQVAEIRARGGWCTERELQGEMPLQVRNA
jgi:hypothetical protein